MTPLPKYLARHLERTAWPQLLVLKGKHSTEHYLLADPAALWASALEVLRSRIEDEGYIGEPEAEPYGIEEGELVQEEIDKLPEHYRKLATALAQRNGQRRKEHADEIAEWHEAQQALSEGDGVAAYLILERRRGYEYEGFELTDVRVPMTPRARPRKARGG